MKPYTLTISVAEQSNVCLALRRGLFCAKEQEKAGMIGAGDYILQIEAALEIMNRPCEGGYESQQESNAAFLESFAADCAAHGCD